mgnify:CR=1 FL=1
MRRLVGQRCAQIGRELLAFGRVAQLKLVVLLVRLGARAVYVDIDPRTYALDASRLEAAGERERLVRLYGRASRYLLATALPLAAALSRQDDASGGQVEIGRRQYTLRFAGRFSPEELRERLDRLEAQVEKVSVPLSYADELYALRNHIGLVRQRLATA